MAFPCCGVTDFTALHALRYQIPRTRLHDPVSAIWSCYTRVAWESRHLFMLVYCRQILFSILCISNTKLHIGHYKSFNGNRNSVEKSVTYLKPVVSRLYKKQTLSHSSSPLFLRISSVSRMTCCISRQIQRRNRHLPAPVPPVPPWKSRVRYDFQTRDRKRIVFNSNQL